MQLSAPRAHFYQGKAFQSVAPGRAIPPRVCRQVPIKPTAKIPGVEQATAALKTYRAVSNLPSWVTTVAFTAFQVLPKITHNPLPFVPDSSLLFNLLAWYTLLYAGTSLFNRKVPAGVGARGRACSCVHARMVWKGTKTPDTRGSPTLPTPSLHPQLEFDGVGTVIGPAYLAVQAMGGLGSFLSPLNVATALFGVFLSYRLPVRTRERAALPAQGS